MPYRSGVWTIHAARRVCAAAGVRHVVPYSHRGRLASDRLHEILQPVAKELGQGGPQVTNQHYLNAQARQEAEQAFAREHQRELDRDSRAAQILGRLEYWRQQGVLPAEPGALALVADDLMALDASPPAVPTVAPNPTAGRSRAGRLNEPG